mgnify:CR=1 FL=1
MDTKTAQKELNSIKKRENELLEIIKNNKPKSIMEIATSIDVVLKLSTPKDTEWYYKLIKIGAPKHIIAHELLIIIISVLNEGWVPDYTNTNEWKYNPIFILENGGSGFVFSNTYYVLWTTNTTVGSRLVLRTSALAKFCGQTFLPVYNDFIAK